MKGAAFKELEYLVHELLHAVIPGCFRISQSQIAVSGSGKG
jgi:hypothetical protein